jgi:hypothetical protein
METINEIPTFLRAGFSGFWVRTQEPRRVESVIRESLKSFTLKDGRSFAVGSWDCASNKPNPVEPITKLDSQTDPTVLLLKNYHFYLDRPNVIQAISNRIDEWKADKKAVVVISPYDKIPPELERDFLPMELPLPVGSEVEQALGFIVKSANKNKEVVKMPEGEHLSQIVEAAKGMTWLEMENVFSTSLIKAGDFDPTLIYSHKKSIIEAGGYLTLIEPNFTFEDYIGYDQLKRLALRMVKNPRSRGLLMISPPGCGKTYFMICLAGESKVPAVAVNFGMIFSKFQGESDRNVNQCIDVIKAIGKCMVQMDEFEKQFAGAGSTGELDSGTSRRVSGSWLRFMGEPHEGIYFIGTCNSFAGIPDEYLRIGRFDTAPFFLDLPDHEQRLGILKYHADKRGVEYKASDDVAVPNMDNWTASEIEGLVHIADVMDTPLNDASSFIIPQATTKSESITKLREWAKGTCTPASSLSLNGDGPKLRAVDFS